MEPIAFVRTDGRGGSNAVRFCFSHPRGHVMTSSSNVNVCPFLSRTRVSSFGSVRHEILSTMESSFIVAFESAGLETSWRIFSYVPAQKRFSMP